MMKKDAGWWLAASAVIMLALPWMAVTFIKGDGGMAACFLLFYAVNPVYSLAAGTFAGRDGRRLWSLPVISAALFLCGTWLFFAPGESAFLLYAAVYLVLGMAAFALSLALGSKPWLR